MSLQTEVFDWVQETFPGVTVEGRIKHLKEEIEELAEQPNDPMEMADCVLILCTIASLQGYDLLEESRKKFEIIKKRDWDGTDSRGIVRRTKIN